MTDEERVLTDAETAVDSTAAPSRARRPRAVVVVAAMLIGTSLVSVTLMAVFVHIAASDLLNDTAEEQLSEIAGARAGAIEEGVLLLQRSVTTLAEDEGIALAMSELGTTYTDLDVRLDEGEFNELEAYYESDDAVASMLLDDPVPGSETARYLQYHYLVENPFPSALKSGLDASSDGSDYSAAHARHHPVLRNLLDERAWNDLVLVDVDTGALVYSVTKRDDFATDLRLGPHRRTRLADAMGQVASLPPGEALFIDFSFYPASGEVPTAFIAAPIRRDGLLIGVVAVSLPVAALTQITTTNGEWVRTGLGETGEVYVVGDDLLMRSASRGFIEDPDDYLARAAKAGYPIEVTEAIEASRTTVLTQPVETEAVEDALAGDRFFGVTRNYLDDETVTVAAPLLIDDVQWIAVAEIATAEAHEPLSDNLRRVVVAGVILAAVVALVAVWLARRLLRPLQPLVAATHAVSEGDLEVPPLAETRDEFGELGRTLNETVDQLREQQARLSEADEETTELLMAALPRRLAMQVKEGKSRIVEAARNGTIVVLRIDGLVEGNSNDPVDMRELGVDLLGELSLVADDHGVEPVHSTSTQLMWAAGLASGELEAEHAVTFVEDCRARIAAFARLHGLSLAPRFGLASGELVAGLVGTDRLAFDAWGEPVRIATSLCAIAENGQILGDGRLVETLGDEWPVERADRLVGLTGERLDAWVISPESPDGVDVTTEEDAEAQA